ncbi:ROC104 [Auxenochlorella protothecoides x Auxenochlorella symbiontica]
MLAWGVGGVLALLAALSWQRSRAAADAAASDTEECKLDGRTSRIASDNTVDPGALTPPHARLARAISQHLSPSKSRHRPLLGQELWDGGSEGASDPDMSAHLDSVLLDESASELHLTSVDPLQRVGRGASGSVYKASWHGAPVAVKYIPCRADDARGLRAAVREVVLSKQLGHPHVVQCYDWAVLPVPTPSRPTPDRCDPASSSPPDTPPGDCPDPSCTPRSPKVSPAEADAGGQPAALTLRRGPGRPRPATPSSPSPCLPATPGPDGLSPGSAPSSPAIPALHGAELRVATPPWRAMLQPHDRGSPLATQPSCSSFSDATGPTGLLLDRLRSASTAGARKLGTPSPLHLGRKGAAPTAQDVRPRLASHSSGREQACGALGEEAWWRGGAALAAAAVEGVSPRRAGSPTAEQAGSASLPSGEQVDAAGLPGHGPPRQPVSPAESFNSDAGFGSPLKHKLAARSVAQHPRQPIFELEGWELGPHDAVLAVVMEFCDVGSLGRALSKGAYLPSAKWSADVTHRALLRTAQEVAKGMAYIHSHDIVHGDLKPANVLLTTHRVDRRGYVAKVADFGLVRNAGGCGAAGAGGLAGLPGSQAGRAGGGVALGTVAYAAPEVIAGGPATTASDVFAFGIMLWEMYHCCSVHSGVREHAVLAGVVQGTLRPVFDPGCPPAYAALARDCWAQESWKRPTFQEVLSRLVAAEMAFRAERHAGRAASGTHAVR